VVRNGVEIIETNCCYVGKLISTLLIIVTYQLQYKVVRLLIKYDKNDSNYTIL